MAAPSPRLPRRALVTGAARRLGRAIALGLARDGFDIALHYHRSGPAARRTAAEIRALGRSCVLLAADLADPRAVAELVPRATEALGPLGLLVNNASHFGDDHGLALDPAALRHQLAVDLEAPLALALAFARALPSGAEGLVVNLLDARILAPSGRRLGYTAAKAGLWGATRVLARRLAPAVRVVALAPDLVMPAEDTPPATVDRLTRAAPLARRTTPEELVAAIRFVLAAPSITGVLLPLDAGRLGGPLLP